MNLVDFVNLLWLTKTALIFTGLHQEQKSKQEDKLGELTLDGEVNPEPIGDCPVCDDSYDLGEKGLNYRSAPFWARLREGSWLTPLVRNNLGPGSNLNHVEFPPNFFLGTGVNPAPLA